MNCYGFEQRRRTSKRWCGVISEPDEREGHIIISLWNHRTSSLSEMIMQEARLTTSDLASEPEPRELRAVPVESPVTHLAQRLNRWLGRLILDDR